MSRIYQTVYSCIVKKPVSEQVEVITDPDEVKENDAPELSADKKTDDVIEPQPQAGYVWRVSSGVYNTATGALGLGVGGIKWAAGKGYDVGHAVVSKVKVPAIPLISKSKDKKE